MSIPPNSTLPLREIRRSGFIPIIAHPERYSNMATNADALESWRDAGALIQINSGSLIGQYGSGARRLVWSILEQGWADFMSSDYHSRGRCSVTDAANALLQRGGGSQLRALTMTNPERMLHSEETVPVEALEEVQLGFWRKVLGR